MEKAVRELMIDALAIAAARGFLGRAGYLVASGYARASAEYANSAVWMVACAALEVVADNMRREGAE